MRSRTQTSRAGRVCLLAGGQGAVKAGAGWLDVEVELGQAEVELSPRGADRVEAPPSGLQGQAEMDEVQRAIDEHGLHEAVRLLPPQPHEILSTFFRAADACVVPSHSESFGLVALEAAACGIPVVAAAVGGLTTLVRHGVTGMLVEGREPSDYARPLTALLADPEGAARMGRRAAVRARSYTWGRAAEDLWGWVDTLTRSALVACG